MGGPKEKKKIVEHNAPKKGATATVVSGKAVLCPVCRTSLNKSNFTVHYESKHAKLPVPDFDTVQACT